MWWGSSPRWVRWVTAGYVIGFVEGMCAHIRDLFDHRWHAYDYASAPLRVFDYSLLLLDPLAAFLAVEGRRSGLILAAAIMAADLPSNWWENRRWIQQDPVRIVEYPGLLGIVTLTVFVVATFAGLWREFGKNHRAPQPV